MGWILVPEFSYYGGQSTMEQPNRRTVLQIIAGLPLAAGAGPAFAEEPLIGRLIAQSRALPRVSQRINFISGALLGVRYQANTLIGGPGNTEVFVVRDDAFDCVTYCEVVLAAAFAWDLPEFEVSLRRIRYEHGQVKWDERNHYFADWSRRAVENRICRPVSIEPSVTIEKTVNWQNLGERRVSLTVIPRATFIAKQEAPRRRRRGRLRLAPAQPRFPSRRARRVRRKGGELMLRHASQSHGRIIDERMDRFVAVNGVQYVTVVRATESAQWPVAPDTYMRRA